MNTHSNRGETSVNGYIDPVVIEAAAEAMAAENRACAARHTAAYELYEECLRAWRTSIARTDALDFMRVDPARVCRTHLVAAFAIGDRRAGRLLAKAVEFTERLPAALAAMADGLMDENTANIIADQTCTVHADQIGAIQSRIVAELLEAMHGGQRLSAAAIKRHCDAIIAEMDPEGLKKRSSEAIRDRHVRIESAPDGMADLHARLTASEAAAIGHALDGHPAASVRGTADDRNKGERRADALCAMALNTNQVGKSCSKGGGSADGADGAEGTEPTLTDLTPAETCETSGQPDKSEPSGSASPVIRPQVTIIADPRDGRFRVLFDRSGPGAVEDLILLLARSAGVPVNQLDPAVGAADKSEYTTRYRPSASLERQVRLRDGTCRHPGCAVPAIRCDIDHLVPFDHQEPGQGGPTTESNLVCLCRSHHRLKTFTGWNYQLSADGLLRVTIDSGHTLYTLPSGPLAQARRLRAQRTGTGAPADPPPF